MSYPKPLSEKSLQKMYKQSEINEAKSEFLHKFFLAAANLYGSVWLKDLWEIYKEYSINAKTPKLQRKDFIAFSAIARREVLPYQVYEVDELYSEEPRKELDRCIVLKSIINDGYGRFKLVYDLHELQSEKPYYIPEDLLLYVEPQITEEEHRLKDFLEHLKVEATQYTNSFGKTYTCEHVGEFLKDFSFLNQHERFEAEYLGGEKLNGPKRNQKKLDAFLEACSGSAAEKILRKYKERIMIGWIEPGLIIKYFFDELEEMGVLLSEEQMEELLQLLNNFQNYSHLWCNRGWTPFDLARYTYREAGVPTISIGPGIQRAIEEGTIDGEELMNRLKEMGIEIV